MMSYIDEVGEGSTDRVARIQALNDHFRRTMHGGRLVVTNGVRSLGHSQLSRLVQQVQEHSDFGANNDPHGEHDFGAIDFNGRRVFWKIDYYDEELKYGSEDPSDPGITTRVLTIMLAEEY